MDSVISKAIEEGIPVLLAVAGLFFILVAIAEIEKIKINGKPLRFFSASIGFSLLVIGVSLYLQGSNTSVTDEPNIDESDIETLVELPSDWFSSGESIIFSGHSNADRDFGVAEFKDNNYDQAANFFEKAVFADPNDPEVQIYLNNSKIRKLTSRVVLAAIVPAEKEQNYAEAILRGVADSQRLCNENQQTAIEILIVDDGNDINRVSKVSNQVVEMKVNNKEIVGVIGHYTSSATREGLKAYDQSNLAVISPTSTSDFLQSKVFFRTPPSDRLNGSELAKYVIRSLGKVEVEVLYTPDDPYSESLLRAFKTEFEKLGGTTQENDISAGDLNVENFIESLDEEVSAIVLLPSADFAARAIALSRVTKGTNSRNALPLFGGDTLYSPEILQGGGSAVEGLVIAIPWFPTERSAYATRASERWGGQVNWATAMSFDATQAFCYAISDKTSISRSDIIESLNSISVPASDTSGAQFSFDSSGNATRSPVLVKVVNALEDPEVDTPRDTNYGFKLIEQ